MGTKHAKKRIGRAMHIAVILAILLSVSTVVYAAPPSPFVGHWQAVDVDEGDIRLTIAGPPSGPYQITWTESYISFCDGEAGIVRGMGWLDEANPYILEADLHLECFTTGNSTNFHMVWRYWPESDTLISQYEEIGYVIIWHHPGSKVPSMSIPTFVAYIPGAIEGYDWQLGDTVYININDGEYTAESSVEEAPWDPTQTRVLFELWQDDFFMETWDHIVMTDGFITKEVWVTDLAVTDFDLSTGQISGTYTYDPESDDYLWVWLYDGDGQIPTMNPDGTWITTFDELSPGVWGGATQWDMDGDGTSLDFQVPNPTFVAYVPGAVEGYDWPMGDEISLTVNGVPYPVTANSEQRPDFPEGETRVLFEIWQEGWSLSADDYVVMTDIDSGFIKYVTVTNLAVTGYNLAEGTVSGIYDPTYDLWVWLYDGDGQVPTMNPDGTWIATFDELSPGAWGGATQWEPDGDGTSIDFQIPGE